MAARPAPIVEACTGQRLYRQRRLSRLRRSRSLRRAAVVACAGHFVGGKTSPIATRDMYSLRITTAMAPNSLRSKMIVCMCHQRGTHPRVRKHYLLAPPSVPEHSDALSPHHRTPDPSAVLPDAGEPGSRGLRRHDRSPPRELSTLLCRGGNRYHRVRRLAPESTFASTRYVLAPRQSDARTRGTGWARFEL